MTRREAPLLVISHFAENRGTTDYFIEHLVNKGMQLYYLRHPLPETDFRWTELWHYAGPKPRLVKKYPRSSSFLLKTLKELTLNFRIGLLLRIQEKVRTVVGFGAINVTAPALMRFVFSTVIFWGVDYSSHRFRSNILSGIYRFLETLACLFSTKVVQPTEEQAQLRIKYHRLKSDKSIVAPNGVQLWPTSILPKDAGRPAFLYVGSLSPLHGVEMFIEQMIKTDRSYQLIIIGNGERKTAIDQLIQRYGLESNVKLLGSRSPEYIRDFITNSKCKLIGIAPYVAEGHVVVGDSLKIKEYVNYGLTYVASGAVRIDGPLKEFGFIYESFEELRKAMPRVVKLQVDDKRRRETMARYSWGSILDNRIMPLLSEGVTK